MHSVSFILEKLLKSQDRLQSPIREPLFALVTSHFSIHTFALIVKMEPETNKISSYTFIA